MSTNVVYLHNLPEKMRDMIKSNIGECKLFTKHFSRVYFELIKPLPTISTELSCELRDIGIFVEMGYVSIIRKSKSFKVVE